MANIGFDCPLDGVRVLDLSRLLPGPFCSMLLADMGADVVKVEGPQGGDYARWYPPLVGDYGAFFAAINRGKRSLALDLKKPGAAQLLVRLAANADVVLESFRPGVADRLGIGWRALSHANPRLVYCAITGYGHDGPLRDRAGHDVDYLALAGLLEQTGEPERAPVIPGFQLADIAGGALFAATGITTALFQAARTGKGAFLDVAMTEGALAFHAPLQAVSAAGQPSVRGDAMLTGGLPCYRVYPTGDGGHLAVGALEPKFWAAFVAAIGLPELATSGFSQGTEGAAVVARVTQRLTTRSRDEWAELLGPADACVEPVLRPDEVRNHPQHVARNVFWQMDAPGGAQLHTATPLTPRNGIGRPAPGLGEHTREVLREAGIADDEVAQLLKQAVVV